jgi:hypothetical protein
VAVRSGVGVMTERLILVTRTRPAWCSLGTPQFCAWTKRNDFVNHRTSITLTGTIRL